MQVIFLCLYKNNFSPFLDSTKAEIRFSLSEADWLPKKVRERLQQKYSGNINNNKELFLTSMRTRSSVILFFYIYLK